MKLTDKAILRMVSESPGRNTSEPIGGPEKIDPRGRVLVLPQLSVGGQPLTGLRARV